MLYRFSIILALPVSLVDLFSNFPEMFASANYIVEVWVCHTLLRILQMLPIESNNF